MKPIDALLNKLPRPNAGYAARGVEFDVYRAKDLYRSHWNSGALREITLLCRKSYSRYGKRPLLDEYDKKSAIYLVRAKYSAKSSASSHIEEWLSIRMVPGDGTPLGVHEPEIFEYHGKSADYLMRRKIGGKDFWRHVAGSQRMCGIHPYAIAARGAKRKTQVVFLGDPGHKFTPICFALMHAQFVRDYPLDKFPYFYITALIRPDYYKKGLSYRVRGRNFRPAFTDGNAFLSLRRGCLRVKRDVFSYRYPLYWFDAKKLLVAINSERKKGHKLPVKVLAPRMFYNISKEMRVAMDRLPDAPGLKITPAERWYRGMAAILKVAGIVAKN
ncbi:MAG: hypothetical protein KGJ13_06790 [Patescibacteria group bacterium]|nr:hypothetical protein [Patescibacteria group bacterium]